MLNKGFVVLVAAAMSVTSFAQGDPDTVSKIISEGKGANKARFILERITGDFGSRLTSSTYLFEAQK